MTGCLQRRFKLLPAAAALACWILLPGTAIDRAAFSTVSRGFANPPFFISGGGSHTNPWNLRTFASTGRGDARQAPVIVSLGDDPDGFFQSSPPSPIDLAVIFTNFQRLGAKKAASATVLAWDSPDPIGLAALDKAISQFVSLVMAAPLSRGAVPEPMPPAFRKASIPVAKIHGNPAFLPVVNRVPLPGIILGYANTLAGFQTLESEPTTGFPPLLARWDDRVVLAFPLLVALQRLDLTAEQLEVRLGEYLRLGPTGPILPIDRYGRLTVAIKTVSPYAEIPAEALIDGGDNLFPKEAPEPVILRDDRSAAEPATRCFSKKLPSLISAITSDTGLAPAHTYPRLRPGHELIWLSLLALALAAICRLPTFSRNIALSSTAAVCLSAQFIAAATAQLWLPGLPALVAILTAFGLSKYANTAPTMAAAPKIARPPSNPPKQAPRPAPAKTPSPPAPPVPGKTSPGKKSRSRGKKRRR